jgi:hypothetical protein
MASWEFIDPPKVVERDIPVVAHHAWSQLDRSEKLAAIDRFVAQAP